MPISAVFGRRIKVLYLGLSTDLDRADLALWHQKQFQWASFDIDACCLSSKVRVSEISSSANCFLMPDCRQNLIYLPRVPHFLQ